MCAQTQHAFQPVYMSISGYESVHCVLRQMQLTVLSINTIFSSMLHDGGKVIFCSRRGRHFAEHREGGGGQKKRGEYPVYVNPLQLDLAV